MQYKAATISLSFRKFFDYKVKILVNCYQEAKLTITSRPKARDGHQYPCPAFVFTNGSSLVSRAVAPEGTGGVKVL